MTYRHKMLNVISNQITYKDKIEQLFGKTLYLQNALAIAICSRRATKGQNITIDPKFCIMSGKEYSVPLTFVLNGGGANGGSPFLISPET